MDETTTGVELSAPVTQPVARTSKTSATPYPHLFGGTAGKHSWFADMEEASKSPDGSAAERLNLHHAANVRRRLRLAGPVTSADVPPTDPPNVDSYMYQLTPDPSNPLLGVVSTGTLPQNAQPFYVPFYNPAGETNLINPHVEGVEPTEGDIGTFSRKLVEVDAVSGKVKATRETTFNPLVERIIWQAFERAMRKGIHTALGTMLDGLTLPGAQVLSIGEDTAVDDIIDAMNSFAYIDDGDRYNRLLVTQGTWGDLSNAKDADGRRLLNVSGQAVNSDGTQVPGRSINVGGVDGVPISGVTNSYLIDTDVVHVLLGPDLRWTFDYEVANVRYGVYRASAMFVTDLRGVVRLERDEAE